MRLSERDRAREREIEREGSPYADLQTFRSALVVSIPITSLARCVCVCVKEGERERESEREIET